MKKLLQVLILASIIAQSHHEKYNGKGYPLGLKGDEIPLEGRIVAVADVYDALSSSRPYKRAFSQDECLEIILRDRGEHYLQAPFVRARHLKSPIRSRQSRLFAATRRAARPALSKTASCAGQAGALHAGRNL